MYEIRVHKTDDCWKYKICFEYAKAQGSLLSKNGYQSKGSARDAGSRFVKNQMFKYGIYR